MSIANNIKDCSQSTCISSLLVGHARPMPFTAQLRTSNFREGRRLADRVGIADIGPVRRRLVSMRSLSRRIYITRHLRGRTL